MEKWLEKIFQEIKKSHSLQAMTDLKEMCRECIKTDIPLAVEYLVKLSDEIEYTIPRTESIELIRNLFNLHKLVVFLAAPYSFHCYLLAVEWNREPKKKFYPPRRMVLKQVVDALQELHDDKLDLLAISLPPGSGKTTLAIFYLTWLAGKHSDEPMLTGSHSNSFVRGVYDECLRILDTQGEYLWHEVFPTIQVSSTNAKDCRIDLGKRKRFETLEFTSIGTGNAGLYRASRLLYCDDLVSGIEVALSKERLDKLWETYTTDLRQRKIGDHCKELHIATRWSVHDVIGRLENDYGDSDRAKFIVIPALDENDESNFDYTYGVGFNTKFYHEQREIMEDASWRALYMNQPIEREGVLFRADELRRYFELPDGEPDAIISVCDTKSTGMDYCVMPIVYLFGNDYYVEDIVCDNNNPEVVETRLMMALLSHKVQMSRFESNSAGGKVAQRVQEMLKEKGGHTKITTKYTTSNKETKIIVNSPFVKEHCLFKDDSVIKNDKEYRRALNYLCSYSMGGRNKHDDVPDAFAQLSEFAQSLVGSRVEVFKRPF
jgi:predicted phage terminase large subunit-like protein